MNVLYSPRMSENTAGGWLECVFRPCYRYKKHTKPPSWPINLNICPSSWLRVTARLTSWPPYTPASFIAYTSQASGKAYIYKQMCESL